MINSSAAFQAAVARDSRTFSARLLYNGTEISGDIRKITIVKGSCGASDFVPGTVFCPYIEVVMDGCTTALEGKELELLIGLDIGGSVEEIRLGYFTVGKPSTSAFRTTFVAQGRIASMSGAFEMISSSLTIGNVASRITADTSITINFDAGIDTSTPISSAFASNVVFPGLTDRQALEVIAAVVGGYATETADGTVCIKRFDDTVNASCSADSMLEPPEFHDYDTEITGVKVTVSEGGDGSEESYTSGSPVNLELNCAYMTSSAFTAFASGLIGLGWRGGRASLALGDPRLEPWDVLQITDTESNTFVLPCMSVTHIFDGGLQTIVEAPAIVPAEETGSIVREARTAMTLAEDALEKADATEQHFWFTGGSGREAGAHIAEIPKTTFERNPSGGNTLIKSDGVYIRNGNSVLSSFTDDGARIGEVYSSNIFIESDKLHFNGWEGNEALRLEYGWVDVDDGVTVETVNLVCNNGRSYIDLWPYYNYYTEALTGGTEILMNMDRYEIGVYAGFEIIIEADHMSVAAYNTAPLLYLEADGKVLACQFDTNAAAGTVDYEFYNALQAIGWTNAITET